MFTIDKKEYDEKKLDNKGTIALNNVKVLINEKNDLMHRLEKNKILSEHYSELLKKNLPNGEDIKHGQVSEETNEKGESRSTTSHESNLSSANHLAE